MIKLTFHFLNFDFHPHHIFNSCHCYCHQVTSEYNRRALNILTTSTQSGGVDKTWHNNKMMVQNARHNRNQIGANLIFYFHGNPFVIVQVRWELCTKRTNNTQRNWIKYSLWLACAQWNNWMLQSDCNCTRISCNLIHLTDLLMYWKKCAMRLLLLLLMMVAVTRTQLNFSTLFFFSHCILCAV